MKPRKQKLISLKRKTLPVPKNSKIPLMPNFTPFRPANSVVFFLYIDGVTVRVFFNIRKEKKGLWTGKVRPWFTLLDGRFR
jgi:hypothetical protein